MIHVLFVTPYYPPEKGAPMVRISETAKMLVKRGYRVTVLTTFPNYPTGIVPAEYRGHMCRQEQRDGVRVIRVWSYIRPNKGFLLRILAQLSFGCLAPLLARSAIERPDLMIVESPPLFDAIAGRLLAWRYRCPFIFTVADLWPESAIQLGILRNRLLIRMAEWLEWSTYRKAGAVWAVTEGIRDALLQKELAAERVFLLTNGVDTTTFRPLPKAEARAGFGWDDRFTVVYAGTHGLAHGLTCVLDAAERIAAVADVHIVFVGDGATKNELIADARRRNLTNVTFLDPLPHDRMPLLLSASDACLVPLRRLPLFEGALPSKMYEIMACARPILLGADGEARRLVEKEAGAAHYFEPENADALVSAIIYLSAHPDYVEELGRRGRAFVEARFDRGLLTTRLEGYIARLLKKNVGARLAPAQ